MQAEDDRAVFAELYPRLRAFAAVVSPLEDDPDDLVQEALTRTLEGGSFQRLENPGAYLRRTITNLASNRRRRLGNWRRVRRRLEVVEETKPDYPSDLGDLDALSPLDRAVLYLTDVEGWRASDIGELLDLGENAVRLRASRSRRRLRGEIEQAESETDDEEGPR